MSETSGNLRYRDSHEWVRVEDDGTVVVGIGRHRGRSGLWAGGV
jgi:glycine cleavage system H lipoate-binding protein